MSSGKVLFGFLVGAAAGAMAGILLAPEKGSKTRKKIADKGEEYYDTLKETFDESLEAIIEKFEMLKNEFIHYGEKAKEEVEDYAENKMSESVESKIDINQ